MQFKDLSGGAGDRYTVVNLKYQKIGTALNQAGKNDRISRMYERAKERNKGDKNSISKSERRIKELKDKGNLTKKETAELIKLTGEIYKEEKEITKLTERYESLEEITEDKKEYLTYIAGLKDKRKELEKYEIKILYKDENGNIYVKQTSGNPEEKARQEYYMREMQKNSREGINQNVIDKALSTISKIEEMISNGEIVEYKGGGIITGYGITKEEAKRNKEIKNEMLLNGLLQTGEGAVKATTGVSAIAGGATGCYYSGGMGCGIGLQMIGSGIAVGGMGINETYVGLQNIGYALSSGSGIRKGTAIEEYNRIRKEKGYIPANNVKINNPVLNYIVNKGGDERDYQVISAVTGAMATELNIYNNYYKKNSIVNYVEKERADREKNKEFKLKSPLEKQMTELGVETERIDLGLKIDGTTRTGQKIDEIMGNNLGRTFKTFDNFDKNTGIATSVKSINLDAKTYQSGSGLSSKIKNDIGATLDFKEYKLNENYLNSSNINGRVVNIVVDDRPLNQSQIENFKKAIDYGKLNNVKVKVTINGGK